MLTAYIEVIATDTIAPGLIGCLPGPGTNIVFIDFVVLMAYEACECKHYPLQDLSRLLTFPSASDLIASEGSTTSWVFLLILGDYP